MIIQYLKFSIFIEKVHKSDIDDRNVLILRLNLYNACMNEKPKQ